MAKVQKGQLVTKKHLARQERERRQNRIILIVSIAVVVIVVGLIGYGVAQQYIIQPQQPVAKVANHAITTKQFQIFARWERLQLIQQYQQYEQYAQLFASDQSSLSYIQSYMASVSNQLEPATLGQSTLGYLIEDQLIETEAEKRGITVSDAEVDQALQEYFGFYANGTPTPTSTSNPIPTSTLNPTQVYLVPPTFTPIPTATWTPAPTITVTQETATPTPVGSTATPSGPTSTPSPTETPYTLSLYEKNFQTYATNVHSFAGLSESDIRWVFKMQLIRKKLLDVITSDVSRQQDQVWVRHIVVSDQAQAQSIYARLKNGGDFEIIANEVYSGTTNTVDLGWLGKGSLDTNSEDVLFNKMSIGDISEPIQTTSGWEVYQLLGHEVRTLSESQFTQLKNTEFQNWLDQQKLSQGVETFDLWKTRVPTSPTIPPTQTGQ